MADHIDANDKLIVPIVDMIMEVGNQFASNIIKNIDVEIKERRQISPLDMDWFDGIVERLRSGADPEQVMRQFWSDARGCAAVDLLVAVVLRSRSNKSN